MHVNEIIWIPPEQGQLKYAKGLHVLEAWIIEFLVEVYNVGLFTTLQHYCSGQMAVAF
jgi:hypothetical protein